MADAVKLTKTIVDAAKPGPTRRILWDSVLPGFGVRIEKSGVLTYLVRYRVGGGRAATQRETVIGRHGVLTVDQARRIARDMLAEVTQGRDPQAAKRELREAKRVTDLCDRYLADHAEAHKRPSSVRSDRRLIAAHIVRELGARKVVELTREDVTDLHAALRATPYEANRTLALLSKMLNLAERWGWRPDGTNPCRHVQRYREAKRERFLSAAELGRLGAALAAAERGELTYPAGGPIGTAAVAAIRLLLFTGARRSEILELQWDWIDMAAGRANLPTSKTGKKALFLPAPALQVLREIQRIPGNPHVIAGAKKGAHLTDLQKPWNTIRAAAGIPEVRLHDLRHSFASVAAAGGMSLPIIGALLGHTAPATTARYAHLADDPLRAAAQGVGSRIAAALGQSVEGEPPATVTPLAASRGNRGRDKPT